ncbi:LuxR C-terminal-related transcriptional regulator [Amycolatopsis sp. NBC_01480]|uniref:LuxR C-terminal-related transcriptional regulator n=1 Tax=Amycolatopsis sp. NBC_01480 TaxID=2903562 RepID=UPI002E29D35A|nr:LuxR C-terminal-related transcriptional regulator [Amycolatopsis sp. NBC_01480]
MNRALPHPPTNSGTESNVLRAELRRLQTSVPITFGGDVDRGQLSITELCGTRTFGLRNLAVPAGLGLGGRVVKQRRPAIVDDYGESIEITHDFDGPVLREGISSVVAVPVVYGDSVRAVLYGAVRGRVRLGNRTLDTIITSARRITNELRVADLVEERLRQMMSLPGAGGSAPQMSLAALRDVHAELRALSSTVDDLTTRDRLHGISDRLLAISRDAPAPTAAPRLSRRETDVLSQVALGLTNAEIAERLFLLPETVKSYLRSASNKLQTHTRLEAVTAARRAGILL